MSTTVSDNIKQADKLDNFFEKLGKYWAKSVVSTQQK